MIPFYKGSIAGQLPAYVEGLSQAFFYTVCGSFMYLFVFSSNPSNTKKDFNAKEMLSS